MATKSSHEGIKKEENLSNYSLRTCDPRSEFRFGIEEWEERDREPQDWRDVSLQPSYTNVRVPLHFTTKKRVSDNILRYEERMQYEIKNLIAQQTSAYEAARLERHMCYTTLWPPLHSRKEIQFTEKLFYRAIGKKERSRINYLLSNVIR